MKKWILSIIGMLVFMYLINGAYILIRNNDMISDCLNQAKGFEYCREVVLGE